MKKLLLLSATFLGITFAQAQVSYGIKAGATLGKISNSAYEQKTHPSIFVSGYADIPLAKQFAIQSGVSLIGKGSDFTHNYDNTAFHHILSVMTIEVPVNFVYNIPTGKTGKFMLAAGPYIGVNVGGKDNFTATVNNNAINVSNNLRYSGENKDINRIDAGANFMLAYRFTNKLVLSANYGLGLTDIDPIVNGTQSFRSLSLGIGFQF